MSGKPEPTASPLTLSTLTSVAHAFEFVTTTLVHPVYFPYPYATTLHAARVSIAFQANVRASKSRQSWGTHAAGFLIMAWGGGVISHILLGLHPAQLYSVHPYINYLAVHFVLTAFCSVFPSALNPRLFDTLLFPLDAILRVNAITAAVNLLSLPSVDSRLRGSPLTHAILGAIGSAGGGTSAATLGAWTHAWSLSTPVFLRGRTEPGLFGWTAGTVDTLDLWAGSLIGTWTQLLFLGSAKGFSLS
ncbi:hypothetical protein HGRIS_014100 [Hohenbuehelia grisea]|uniref:Uncharacterized protein n=1 Tax=Hohenbuehelia grisea TaxID=104357 RepID=A0ABR3JU20_9AGAR